MKIFNTLVWSRITGQPWAITQTALQKILEVAARENEAPEAIAAKLGRELQNGYNALERDGVAIIPITGPLFRYANMFTRVSGASSYELIARDFASAVENPDITAVVLDIDSPGGEVNGVSELAGMIFEARGKKPIVAYASGDAASGAYWIASAADEIVVSETSALGSIGVAGIYHRKSTEESAEAVEIVSSQSPHKRLDPDSDDGRAKLQTRIDAIADVFVSTLARNRSVTAAHVLEHYGGGDLMIGVHAVNAGLADRIGSLERLIAELSSPQTPGPRQEGLFDSIQTKKEKTMTLEELKNDYPDLVAALRKESAAEEKERLKAILNGEAAQGREKLAREIALNTRIAAQDARHLLESAPKESNSTSFARVMAAIPNPEIAPDGDNHGDDAEAVAKRLATY